jgi:aspartate racemase
VLDAAAGGLVSAPATARPLRFGIWGGMGPDAGNQFLTRFIGSCKRVVEAGGGAWTDNLAPVYFYLSLPIPDRTKAIMEVLAGGTLAPGRDPYPVLRQLALHSWGLQATHIMMICNTVHYWFEPLCRDFPELRFVSLIDTTMNKLVASQTRRVGLMATTGTLSARVYQRALEAAGIELIVPEGAQQELVMEGIYSGVKANRYERARTCFEQVANELLERGVERVILGCTEIPEAGLAPALLERCIDPNELAAQRLARIAYGLEG